MWLSPTIYITYTIFVAISYRLQVKNQTSSSKSPQGPKSTIL
jgi:hypothetical protein